MSKKLGAKDFEIVTTVVISPLYPSSLIRAFCDERSTIIRHKQRKILTDATIYVYKQRTNKGKLQPEPDAAMIRHRSSVFTHEPKNLD